MLSSWRLTIYLCGHIFMHYTCIFQIYICKFIKTVYKKVYVKRMKPTSCGSVDPGGYICFCNFLNTRLTFIFTDITLTCINVFFMVIHVNGMHYMYIILG